MKSCEVLVQIGIIQLCENSPRSRSIRLHAILLSKEQGKQHVCVCQVEDSEESKNVGWSMLNRWPEISKGTGKCEICENTRESHRWAGFADRGRCALLFFMVCSCGCIYIAISCYNIIMICMVFSSWSFVHQWVRIWQTEDHSTSFPWRFWLRPPGEGRADAQWRGPGKATRGSKGKEGGDTSKVYYTFSPW